MQQIIWNLLTNAIKFTPNGGLVEVCLEPCGEDEVDIQVRDTGEGIAQEFIPFLFDRFRQADVGSARRFGGLGLGLAIVKHLVDLHGGTVEAHSPGPGQGTTFAVRLPRQIRRSTPAPPRAAPALTGSGDTRLACDDPRLKGLRVLVVDDMPEMADLVRRVLEEYEAQVTVAYSAAEAFDQVQRNRPHVLISDIGMPVEDGYSLIRRIRQSEGENARLRAIALTAFAQPEDAVRSREAGYQAHINKPLNPAELVQAVAALADHDPMARQEARPPVVA